MYIDLVHGSAEERDRAVKDGKITKELSDSVIKCITRCPPSHGQKERAATRLGKPPLRAVS